MPISDIGRPEDPLPTTYTPLPRSEQRPARRRVRRITRRAEIFDERPGVYSVTLERTTYLVLRSWPTAWVGELVARHRARQATGLTPRQLAGRVRRLEELGLIEFGV
jgi:hypothetical protein